MRTVLQSYSGLGYTVNPVLPSTVTSGGTPYAFQASAPFAMLLGVVLHLLVSLSDSSGLLTGGG
jgi:hypothetical protein